MHHAPRAKWNISVLNEDFLSWSMNCSGVGETGRLLAALAPLASCWLSPVVTGSMAGGRDLHRGPLRVGCGVGIVRSLGAICPLLAFSWKAWEGEELTPGPVGLLQTFQSWSWAWDQLGLLWFCTAEGPGQLCTLFCTHVDFGKSFLCLGHGVHWHALPWQCRGHMLSPCERVPMWTGPRVSQAI